MKKNQLQIILAGHNHFYARMKPVDGMLGLFMSLGVIGEYIARIFAEVKGRPLYLVAERIGGEPPTKG